MDISISVHLRGDSAIKGHAGGSRIDCYPVITAQSTGYPSVTIYPSDMAQTLAFADASLDAVVGMVEKGARIDPDTAEALARLAERALALSFDEDAEARAAAEVQA